MAGVELIEKLFRFERGDTAQPFELGRLPRWHLRTVSDKPRPCQPGQEPVGEQPHGPPPIRGCTQGRSTTSAA